MSVIICDGCGVREPHEHKCHGENAVVWGSHTGKACECPDCNPKKPMSQEEHWKKAYRDLLQSGTVDADKLGKTYREKYDKLETEYREAISKESKRKDEATTLIHEIEAVLHFAHDDIRSSLARDTEEKIYNALQKIKDFYVGKKRK